MMIKFNFHSNNSSYKINVHPSIFKHLLVNGDTTASSVDLMDDSIP
jgi:hypothetical protein